MGETRERVAGESEEESEDVVGGGGGVDRPLCHSDGSEVLAEKAGPGIEANVEQHRSGEG